LGESLMDEPVGVPAELPVVRQPTSTARLGLHGPVRRWWQRAHRPEAAGDIADVASAACYTRGIAGVGWTATA
jgi:hypothetical protein